ncbi:24415_t:CDS:2 [Dentiscutata erythropus]|uniref:intramembrane prenyl-peptidase Rce1 n=1 Tax=Dentiscutata erythropus TaxID=1348616 RepID=A0A9N9FA28_9GLOM|nr:24415_t:CDS:2 [Dentiscutata erythropus]
MNSISIPKDFQISPLIAVSSCIWFTLVYVGLLYFSKNHRICDRNPGLTNTHPQVIVHRIKTTTISCIISCSSVWAVIYYNNGFTNHESSYSQIITLLNLLGLYIPNDLYYFFNIIFFPLGLTMILFLGPLFVDYLDEELPFQSRYNFKKSSPATEELVFRSCMISLLHYAKISYVKIIFLTPLVFAIAHVHHAWENYVLYGRNREAAKRAIISSAFQFSYTTLFGWYATFIFMRTGSFFSPFITHSFANMMGFPMINFSAHPKNVRTLIILALFLGIILFSILLFPMTSPELFGETSLYWN